MAEFFLDVSAIGNEYQAYADTPTTWGVPQDGNGKAGPGHAAAVAVATIDCNGATASGTGTVGVLGVTVSSTLNASGAALATAIVAAINASATATTATYSAALLPLNRLVFARVNPVLSTEVQIMLRIAGTDWNGMTPTRANITGGGVTAFAGGANGPFGYIMFAGTIFGKATGNYGVKSSTQSSGVTDPGLANDLIHVRTRRGGVDLTAYVRATGNSNFTLFASPSGRHRHLRADNGVVWPGDTGVFTLNLSRDNAYTTGVHTLRTSNGNTSIDGNGHRFRFYMENANQGASVGGVRIEAGGTWRIYTEVLFEEGAPSINEGFNFSHNAGGGSQSHCIRCKFIAKGPRTLVSVQGDSVSYSYIDCEFEYFGLTSNVSNIVGIASTSGNINVEFTACRFYDRNGLYSVTSPVAAGMNGQKAVRVVFDSCTGVTDVASGAANGTGESLRQLLWENFGPLRDWRIEAPAYVAEWRANQNFPTLSSTLPTGQPWSIRLLLRNSNVWGMVQRCVKLPGAYRDVTAPRTVTLELLAPSAMSRGSLGLLFAYVDENDIVRYQSTLLSRSAIQLSPTPVEVSSANWTLNGQSGVSPYKLSLTTQYPVKQNTEFVSWVLFTGELASDTTVYLNGEVGIA